MRQLYSVTILLVFLSISSFAQEADYLREYMHESFETSVEFGPSYSIADFNAEPKKTKNDISPTYEKIEEVEDSLKLTKDPKYYLSIGNLYKRLNRKDIAITYFNRAINEYKLLLYKPGADLKKVYKNLYLGYFGLEDFDKILEYSDSILSISPTDTSIIASKAFLYFFNNQYDEALVFCDSMIQEYPEITSSYLVKTMVLISTDTSKTGTADYSYLSVAQRKYPDNVEIKAMAVSCKLIVMTYKKAMAPLFENPPSTPMDIEFALSKEDKKLLKSYKKLYKSLLKDKRFNNNYTIYYSLGLIETIQNNFKGAIKLYNQAIPYKGPEYRDRISNLTSCYQNIITCYEILGDTTNAIIWAKNRIDDLPSVDPKAGDYIYLAKFYLQKEDWGKGRDFLKLAIETDSVAYEAYTLLANSYLLNNKTEEAEKYINMCYKLNPDYMAMYYSYVIQRIYNNDESTAKYLVNKLLDFNPEDTFAIKVKEEYFTEAKETE